MSRSILMIALACLTVAGGRALFAADEKEPVKADAAPGVCDSRLQTLRPVTFCHVTVKTNLQNIGQAAKDGFDKVGKEMADQKIVPSGPPMMVFHGATPDPAADFTLDIGLIVPDDAKPAGDLKVDKLEKFRCMSVLYTGPVKGVSAAYQKVYPDLARAGHTPTAESREMLLYWEGEDSPNNVIQVSVGIK